MIFPRRLCIPGKEEYMLETKRITEEFKDLKQIKHLYFTAFPLEERVSMKYLFSDEKWNDFSACYDGGRFCGFYSALSFGDIVHIIFLAVDDRLRGLGYGSRILSHIEALHAGKRIIVDVEKPSPDAGNNEQRLKRKSFYYRNGYRESGVSYDWRGVSYQILVKGGELSCEEFEDFWNNLDEVRRKEL